MAGLAIPVALVPGVILYGGGGRTGLPSHVENGDRWLIRPDRAFGTAVHLRGEGLTARHGHDGTAMLADVAQTVRGLAGLLPAAHRVGIRAMPQDGPVIGRLPWLPRYYSAVSHGGIGWGPVWAEIAAAEILDGSSEAALDTVRPARFYFETA